MKKYLDIIYFNRKEIIIVLIMLSLFFIYYFLNNNVHFEDNNIVLEKKEISKIYVDIKGEVNSPGVYELEESSRINDLIKLAGGLKSEADVESINLSEKVSDGMLIYIPKKEDNKDVDINIEEKQVNKDSTSNGKVSINNATYSELMSISGIGKVKAEKIVEYRNKIGRFKSLEELMNVSGIGQTTFDKIKDYIKL